MTPHSAIPFAVALGSNLGDRRANLRAAVRHLDAVDGVDLLRLSRLYETPPWGDTDQGDFLNAVVSGTTRLGPHELLAAAQEIERTLGKKVVRRWGPRLIDLDLLVHGDTALDEPGLRLPHPGIRSRPFVYLPLRDVVPNGETFLPFKQLLEPDDAGRAIEHAARAVADPAGEWPSRLCPRRVAVATSSEEGTEALGRAIGRAATPGDLFALAGPLGAGKSVFVRGIARGLGIDGPIQSPSYTLCREYRTGRLPLMHWDFYRLDGEADLESTGFLDRPGADGVVAIEWAEMFADDLPADPVRVRIDRDGDASRAIALDFPAGRFALRAAVQAHLEGGRP